MIMSSKDLGRTRLTGLFCRINRTFYVDDELLIEPANIAPGEIAYDNERL